MDEHLVSRYAFEGPLWRWTSGKTSWYFITLPTDMADEIRAVDAGARRLGFGSIKVQASIGTSQWSTSLFPASQLQSYLLPVKASVRQQQGLDEGRLVAVQLRIRRQN